MQDASTPTCCLSSPPSFWSSCPDLTWLYVALLPQFIDAHAGMPRCNSFCSA